MSTFDYHIPVLLKEAVQWLVTSPEGIYLDATFGRGNHTRAILSQLAPQGRLYALDKDPDAVAYAKQQVSQDKRFTIFHSSFARLGLVAEGVGIAGNVDGILFDLGVSSPQLDNPERGFSFSREGKLDMRMDTTQGQDALSWIADVEEETLANVLWHYGEERYSRRIARAIVAARALAPITTTTALAEVIAKSMPYSPGDKNPATRSFLAIRLFINQELEELQKALAQALTALKVGGRLVVISFHSLEDRIVKQFIQKHEKGEALPRKLPIKQTGFQPQLKSLSKALKPSQTEMENNPRARSAILRVAEKLS